MTVGRRKFLRGSLSAGALLLTVRSHAVMAEAASAGIPTRSSRPNGRPFLLLRSAGDDAFALPAMEIARRHAGSPLAELELTHKIVGAPSVLRGELAQYRGVRLIGVMDDCTHTLLEETLRDLGGSILCRGHHRGRLNSAAASRHYFVTTSATHGIGTALARAMTADGAAFLVREDALYENESRSRDRLVFQAAPWPAVLGKSYALMAAGLWEAGPTVGEQSRGVVADYPRSEALVSLVAEI
jgi:hypothetical protein